MVGNMSWLVTVDAEVSNAYLARTLVSMSPIFVDWKSHGVFGQRVTFSIDADDAETACEVAKKELSERLSLLTRVGECNATKEL